jgi:chromate transporter
MVLKRRWIDDREFLAMLAIGQIMPGSHGIKLTVLIGQELHGAAGAAVALFGLLAAPFAIVIAITVVYARIGEHPVVNAMLDGVAAAVIGLNFATGLASMRGAPGVAAWLVGAATVLGVGVLRWPMLPVIAVLAPVSIGLALLEARRGRA